MGSSYNVSRPNGQKRAGTQKRNTLAITGFFGLALMYSLRYNLSIAIVDMVEHHHHKVIRNTSTHDQICGDLILENNTEIQTTTREQNSYKFKWSERDQGLIQGSFFWGYVITQFPGGFLAQRFGGKWIISIGLLTTGILAIIFPFAAVHGGIPAVLVIRTLQGIGEGVIIPSFAVMLGHWTTPLERASLGTLIFSGMPFGTAATMIISGHLISTHGWPAVFYVPGVLTIIWFVIWSCFVYSTPESHPSISCTELDHINGGGGGGGGMSTHDHGVKFSDIPWKNILTSVPVHAILISHFANTWGHNTLKASGPKYLASVLHFDIKQNAYVSATPYIGQWVFCNVITRFSDALILRGSLSVSASRKLCNTIGQCGTALAYLGLIFSSCNRTLAIICYMLCGSFNGAVYGGFIISPVDISPNYAGVLEGIVNGISNIAGFGAPYVTGIILHNNVSLQAWHTVLWIPVIADFLGNAVFFCFSTAKIQHWNTIKRVKPISP